MGNEIRKHAEAVPSAGLDALLARLRTLIQDARQRALRAGGLPHRVHYVVARSLDDVVAAS